MLSRFRNLHNLTIKKFENMSAIAFDINTDLLYLRGIKRGEEKGIEKGIEQGIEKGILKKSIIGIQNMTEKKMDKSLIADVLELKLTFVNQIQKNLLKKEEIFKLLKKKDNTVEAIAKKLKVHPILVEILKEDLANTKK